MSYSMTFLPSCLKALLFKLEAWMMASHCCGFFKSWAQDEIAFAIRVLWFSSLKQFRLKRVEQIRLMAVALTSASEISS